MSTYRIQMESDNRISLSRFQNADHEYLNTATVTATLYDSDGNTVSGAVGLGLDYVAGSDGDYVGCLPASLSLVAGDRYTLKIVATDESTEELLKYTTEIAVIAGYF